MTIILATSKPLSWCRSKEIEAVGCNGDAAFLEVRVQQLVIEFILNHVDQIFSKNRKASSAENIGNNLPKLPYMSLALYYSSNCIPFHRYSKALILRRLSHSPKYTLIPIPHYSSPPHPYLQHLWVLASSSVLQDSPEAHSSHDPTWLRPFFRRKTTQLASQFGTKFFL